ncbi:peptidase M20D, amidohydrolase [Mesorhizobium loti]|nr:peptidase M20D, amidohydrolase [Mesorhizobium loti]
MKKLTSREDTSAILSNMGKLLPDLEALYKDIHAHPELSMQERRTASIAADGLKDAGYEVTAGVGKRVSWDCSATARGRR